jgi:tight adherence protein C
METIMLSTVFLVLMVGTGSALYGAIYGDYRALEDRVASLAINLRSARGAFGAAQIGTEGLARMLVRLTAKRLPAKAKETRDSSMSRVLAQAGFRRSAALASYRAIQLLLAGGLGFVSFTGSIAGGLDSSLSLLVAGGTAFMGVAIPKYYVLRKARQHRSAIVRQLSDVLDLLVVCVEAGLGIHESISMVGRETEKHGQEIGTEMVLLSHDMSSGASLGDALRRFAKRTDIEELRPLAAAMIQSEQLGAQMAPALRANSDALRTKRRLKAEESAQKATIKILFPLVLFVLPAMLLVIVGPSMVHIMRTIRG